MNLSKSTKEPSRRTQENTSPMEGKTWTEDIYNSQIYSSLMKT